MLQKENVMNVIAPNRLWHHTTPPSLTALLLQLCSIALISTLIPSFQPMLLAAPNV